MKVVVVGSLNCDLVTRVTRLPGPGETVLATEFHTFVGGKGSNQAIAAARAAAPGVRVAMIGRVGRDGHADLLRARLEEAGVDHAHVRVDDAAPTGVALITVDDAGENVIVVAANANGAVTPAHVDAARRAFDGATVVLLQLEIPIDAALRAAEIGREVGARVVLVPAPAPAPSAALDALLAQVDVLLPNETEALLCAGLPHDASPEDASDRLRARGIGTVVVTMGERGALLATAEGREIVAAPRVEAVDTTGAGDAFAGAFAAALAEGQTLLDAVRFGVCAGAQACTVLGAEPSLPRRASIAALAVEALS